MANDTRPIGVFDSGVGGLSILRELHGLLPHENYIFLADQLHVPYGEKTPDQLEDLTARITRFLLKRDIKLLVIACNTATCYGVQALRRDFSIPIVGTVPAVKPAAAASRTRTIAVISTPATSRSDALKRLITDHAQGVTVLTVGCRGLENAVEKGSLDSLKTRQLLKKYISPLPSLDVDRIVLGCTHYPFLRSRIQKVVGKHIKLLDSGSAIAARTRQLLTDSKLLNRSPQAGTTEYFTTKNPTAFSRVASKLLEQTIPSKKAVI